MEDKGQISVYRSLQPRELEGPTRTREKKASKSGLSSMCCSPLQISDFPSWGRKGSTGLQAVVNRTKEHVLKPSNSQNVKPTLKAITKAAHKIYNEINQPFKELFGMSFAKAQTKTPELGLQEKKSTAQLKKQRREKLRQEKKLIEGEWSKRDCDTMLATRQTYKQRQEQRLALFFETPDEAENRAAKRKNLEELGVRKQKRHSPNPDDLEFDKDGLQLSHCMMSKNTSVMYLLSFQPTVYVFLRTAIKTV